MRYLWLLFIIPMFFWLTGGGINLNIANLWYKLNDFCDLNMARGGFHRIGIIWIVLHCWLDIGILSYGFGVWSIKKAKRRAKKNAK